MIKYIDGKLVKLSKVQQIKNVGPRPVYDLQVKDDHNYFANGISVHNCDYHEFLKQQGNRYGKEFFKFNTLFIRYFHRNLDLYPNGPMKRTLRGDSRCLPGNTLVHTNDGLMKISDSTLVGRKATIAGKAHTITKHFEQGQKKLVRVTLLNRVTIEATEDHLFQARSMKGDLHNVQAKDLKDMLIPLELTGSFPEGKLYGFEPALFPITFDAPNQDSYELGYTLGKLTSTKFDVSFTKEKFAAHIQETFGRVSFDIENGTVQEFLYWLGFDWSAKPKEREVPWSVLRGSKEMVTGFIAGSTSKMLSKPTISFASHNQNRTDQLLALLAKLGILGTVDSTGAYISIRHATQHALSTLPFLLDYRMKVDVVHTTFYIPVVSVVPIPGKHEVYDISVDSEEHLFLVNQGVPVHNCFAAVDELGWFPFNVLADDESDMPEEDEREIANADEVHISLERSLLTVRSEIMTLYPRNINTIPQGMLVEISSPSSWKDKIMRLIKESQGSKLTLALQLPTWEMNPQYTRDHPVITEEYRKNAIKAERDYGANPPTLASSIYPKSKVLPLFKGENFYLLKETVTERIGEETSKLSGVLVPTQHTLAKWPASVMALDAGLSNNAFAIAVGHLQQDSTLRVTTLLEIVPSTKRKINFPDVYRNIIQPLIRNCNVHFVFADRWNSIQLLQQVEEESKYDVLAKQYSLKKADFDTFDSDFIEPEALILPKLELEPDFIESVSNYKLDLKGAPSSHLYLQFLTVRLLQGMVMKGDGYTDDLYRALVLLAAKVRDPKVKKHINQYMPSIAEETAPMLGAVSGRTLGSFF